MSIDPDTLEILPRLSRRPRHAARQAAAAGGKDFCSSDEHRSGKADRSQDSQRHDPEPRELHDGWRDEMLKYMNEFVTGKEKDREWNRKGPQARGKVQRGNTPGSSGLELQS